MTQDMWEDRQEHRAVSRVDGERGGRIDLKDAHRILAVARSRAAGLGSRRDSRLHVSRRAAVFDFCARRLGLTALELRALLDAEPESPHPYHNADEPPSRQQAGRDAQGPGADRAAPDDFERPH